MNFKKWRLINLALTFLNAYLLQKNSLNYAVELSHDAGLENKGWSFAFGDVSRV